MKSIRTVAIVIASLVLGWAAGRAQTPPPDFELIVNAPGGELAAALIPSGVSVGEPLQSKTTNRLTSRSVS